MMNSQRESFIYKLTQIFLILGALMLLYFLLVYVNGSSVISAIFQGIQDPLNGITSSLDGMGRGIGNAFVDLLR
jgi:hypothetical protein